MKLGISSHTFGWKVGVLNHIPQKPMKAIDIIEWAKMNDVDIVQIADNLPLHKMEYSELRKIIMLSNNYDIKLEVGMRGLFPELLCKYIEIANLLESKLIRIVIDSSDYYPSIEKITSILKDFEKEFIKNKITLGIENHDRFKAETLIDILRAVDSEAIGICLDTANSLGAGEGINEIINILGPWTVNLHIKDFIIKRVDYKMGFTIEGAPAGEGHLDIPELIYKLQEYGKNNVSAILELWTPPEATLDETMQKEDYWASKSIKNLRNLI